tara:strand:- start:5401 stop:5928 length:528 start_codon:yes stop_codon:yes gene_type:complete
MNNIIKPLMRKTKVIIFDRDNTLTVDKGYTNKIDDLRFLPGVIKSLSFLSEKKIKIYVATNQSGIARGLFKKRDMFKFHNKMNQILKKNNSMIKKFYYCPHHIDGTVKIYKKNCKCRKPKKLLLEKIKKENKNAKILMIGDKITDKIASKNANIKFRYKKKKFYKQIKYLVNNFF